MSNYLAIATVTATLQRILQTAIQQDVQGSRVTNVKPDANGSGTPEVGVNIYMYQATHNPDWRNADLRTRRPKGELGKQAQAGIDLFYLMTFYGNEVELEPQRLLGSTIRTLIDKPVLTQEIIQDTVNTFSFLQGSTLAEQVERVTLTPMAMNTEELSKIWSVLFQTPYILSFAYQGSTVLIEGDKPGKVALPVQSRRFYITPNQPVIEQVVSSAGVNQPFVLSDAITIRGKKLQGHNLKIKIGEALLTPQEITDTQIKIDLSSLLIEEVDLLKAGVQSLQVIHGTQDYMGDTPSGVIASNILPFVLCPTITTDDEVEVSRIEIDNDLYNAELTVTVDLSVGQQQRVFLLLNERISANPVSYVFKARSQRTQTRSLIFVVKDIKPGDYLVRVQIDGAESFLRTTQNSDEYISPRVEIR